MFDLLSRLRNPAIFQGNMGKRHYFEGWYFKHVGSDGAKLAIIPGISLTETESHAFIQVFNGRTCKSHYSRFPIEEFLAEKEPFAIEIGGNRFSLDGIKLDIEGIVRGNLSYRGITPYEYPCFERGVMGWFGYVPFMETNHGLLSFNHRVSGSVVVGDETMVFEGGDGYIEKDWGESFPSSWIWMQSNSFDEIEACLMLSTAVIPWLGSSFIGHIAVLRICDETFNLSTYRGGRITELEKDQNKVRVKIQSNKYTLLVDAYQGASVKLKSPEKGLMKGRTIESLDSTIEVILLDWNETQVFSGVGINAGLEIMDDENRLGRGLGL